MVLNELTEVDHQAPWVRSERLKPLEEDHTDLLLNVWLGLVKQAKQYDTEEECVTVGISQLVDDTVEEAQSSLIVEHHCDLLEKFNAFTLNSLSVVRIHDFLLADDRGNVQDNCVDDRRLRDDLSVDLFFA